MSEKKTTVELLQEGDYETPKKENRSRKVIPKEMLEKIEQEGITSEEIDKLGVPVFKYQTQITLHGNFDGINTDLNGLTNYKTLVLNNNKTLGIRNPNIDVLKKKKLKEYCYVKYYNEYYVKKKHEPCWHVELDSRGWECAITYDSSKVDIAQLKKDIIAKFKPILKLVGGSLYFSPPAHAFLPRCRFSVSLNYIYEKDMPQVLKAFTGIADEAEYHKIEAENEAYDDAIEKAREAKKQAQEKQFDDEMAGLLARIGLGEPTDKSEIMGLLYGEAGRKAQNSEQQATFFQKKQNQIRKPLRLVAGNYNPNHRWRFAELYIPYPTKVEYERSTKTYKVQVESRIIFGQTKLSANKIAETKDEFFSPSARLENFSLRTHINLSSTQFWLLPDFPEDENIQPTLPVVAAQKDLQQYANTIQRLSALVAQQNELVLIPNMSSPVYAAAKAIAQKVEPTAQYRKTPRSFEFSSPEKAAEFINQLYKPDDPTSSPIPSNGISNFSDAAATLQRDGNLVSHQRLSKQIWEKMLGLARIRGGWKHFKQAAFQFKTAEQAAQFIQDAHREAGISAADSSPVSPIQDALEKIYKRLQTDILPRLNREREAHGLSTIKL